MKPNLFKEISQWQVDTFGAQNPLSKAKHLKKEVDELISDIETNNPDRRLEYADCFLLLYGAAAADGMSLDDIYNCIMEKMDINYQRTWGAPDADGIVNHIKEQDGQE